MTPRPAKRAERARKSGSGRSRVRALAARLGEPFEPETPDPRVTPAVPLDAPYPRTLHGPDTGLGGRERALLRAREERRKAATRAYYFALVA